MYHVLVFLLIFTPSNPILDTSFALLSRQKRTLIWQPGLNWVQMVVGIGLPVEIKDTSVTMGPVVKSYYRLPNQSSDFTHPTVDLARRKRSISRWKLYGTLLELARGYGYEDAKSCLLRTICDSASAPFDDNDGLLAEILHLVLTPSSTDEEIEDRFDSEYTAAEKVGVGVDSPSCGALFPCDADFMTRFTEVFMW